MPRVMVPILIAGVFLLVMLGSIGLDLEPLGLIAAAMLAAALVLALRVLRRDRAGRLRRAERDRLTRLRSGIQSLTVAPSIVPSDPAEDWREPANSRRR